MKKYRKLIQMITVMVGITAVCAALLAYVYSLTAGPIQQAKDNRELEAIREIIPTEFDNNPFAEKTSIANDTMELYPARREGTIVAVAIKSYTNKGFGGKIEMIVGFTLDGTVTGYKIIDHKETPGLGTKVMDEEFSAQFLDINPNRHNINVKQDGGEIDAVTSATISSRAVSDAIQRASDAYSKFSTGGKTDDDDE